MVKLDCTYQLAKNEGSSQKANNKYIIMHETGNPENTGDDSATREASFMHRNWQNAYTQAIAGWDRVYIIGEPGYVAYGAMASGNNNSPFQIELARYADKNKALYAYKNWVEIAREMAKKYGIPLTLDCAGNGIKSHKWISDTYHESDHQDPYSYLSSLGISKAKLASDLANGVGNVAPSPKPAAKPTPKTAPKPKPSAATGWIAERGKFKLNTAIKLRTGASTCAGVIAVLQAGDVVKYNAFIHAGGYIWIRQPRGNGYGYLATGVSANGRRQNYWGSFS